ncbi:MAG: hypothetical protein US40_C0002G0039 [Candidatus Roizmanbacteria bacterium GW2011_GWC2_37_13]|uniref:Uncharacterized protein n=1 Tax=Candidatus Roizmanbacteria bacterium GW2011_GWC2_37_13 TaxID=1618486 RepID=A0A0G0GK32_9BACT|nr:MAG: hypothetical protein US38_C0006G0039 [Candidatus Roizmanbacteria bacterium GW2011_GWC1_37_12]KKQ26505.1 MAG: hypothetical protein US40_C0002G0039 [Candidatus Roizmanbacteria bacterium GW2011_GWC2_37_13]
MDERFREIAAYVGLTLSSLALLYFGFVKPLLKRSFTRSNGQREDINKNTTPLAAQSPLNTDHDFTPGGGFPRS